MVEDLLYNEDAHNPGRDQIVWVTPLAITKSWLYHFVIERLYCGCQVILHPESLESGFLGAFDSLDLRRANGLKKAGTVNIKGGAYRKEALQRVR